MKLKQSSLLIKFITYQNNNNNNPRGRWLSFTEHIRSLMQHFIHGKKFMLQYSLVNKNLFISTLNKQQKGQNYYKVIVIQVLEQEQAQVICQSFRELHGILLRLAYVF